VRTFLDQSLVSIGGMRIIESPVRFEPAIKLGEAAPVSDECRSSFNEWLVEMFGMKDVSIMKKGTAFVFDGKIAMRSDDARLLRTYCQRSEL
jgi:hypothetical protein